MSVKKYQSRDVTSPLRCRKRTRLRRLIEMAAMPLLFLLLATAVRGQSALDGFDPNANGPIRVFVVQPDGKILVGGDFTTLSPNGGAAVTRNHIARLNPDGTLDTAFNPNAGNHVFSIVLQADGKILAGGFFTSIGGQMRNNIARLDPATGLADSFDPNANSAVYSIAVQADGKILAGGNFTSIGGQTRNSIARLDAKSGLVDSFNPNASGGQVHEVLAIVVQADGKILAGGRFTSIGGAARNRIARLDATTGLADSFDPNANSDVISIALQADGKILVGGQFNGANSIGGQARNRIARLDATSGLADSLDPNASNLVISIAVQADGKILAGGLFTSIGGEMRMSIARLDATTGLADSFDLSANTGVFFFAIAVQADGKILTGGSFTSIHGQTRNRVARLEADGRLDQTLNLSVVGSYVDATALQPDGKILIGGSFTTVLGVARNNIARLNADGTLDTVFDPNANADVYSIAVQADGKVLIGGGFNGANSIGGQSRNRIARLDATTGLADSFDPSANGIVRSIAVEADGKILAAGAFAGANSIGGQSRNHIARLDPTTGFADSFNPNANDEVVSIAVQADGRILAGGLFSGIGGQMRQAIARLDVTTGLADSFDPHANGWVFSIAVQADGRILAGGNFTSIGGETRNRIARLSGTTGLADSFNPNANGGTFPEVYAIALQADGEILVGGYFTGIGGEPRNLFARLSNDTAALQNVAVTPSTLTWRRGGSSPQFARVTFEYSADSVDYTPVGNGTATGSDWALTGLKLPTGENFYIRARGYYRGGFESSSESMTESVRNAFLSVLTPTSRCPECARNR